MAKLSSEQFKSLQIDWYKKLEESGFEDVERLVGNSMLLKQFSNGMFKDNVRRTYTTENLKTIIDADAIHFKQRYFELLYAHANDEKTWFRNDIDKFIMQQRAEGAKIKEICLELKTLCKGRDRYSVRIIIRRYEMLWGIKAYTRKQLHRKE